MTSVNSKIQIHWVFIIILFIQAFFTKAFANADLSDILLLDSVMFDDRTIVIGEHGHIFTSDDQQDWRHVESGVDTLLTAITHNRQGTLLAVGHDANILYSINRGESWQLVYSDIEYEAPLLDIDYVNEHKAIAVGAYGLYVTSDDGGQSWQASSLNIINESGLVSEDDIVLSDLHLNSFSVDENGLCVIAAESGYVFVSMDFGKQWRVIKSPYTGSFFGSEILNDEVVLFYGLRGTIYKFNINTKHWQAVESDSNELLHASVMNSSTELYIVGHGATILKSVDQGNSFDKIAVDSKTNFTSIIKTDNNRLMLTSDDGIDYLQ